MSYDFRVELFCVKKLFLVTHENIFMEELCHAQYGVLYDYKGACCIRGYHIYQDSWEALLFRSHICQAFFESSELLHHCHDQMPGKLADFSVKARTFLL